MSKHQETIKTILEQICAHHPELLAHAVELRRDLISDVIWSYHSRQVAYGPFNGLKLTDHSHWGNSDKGVMCLGLYEQELLNDLTKIPSGYDVFIDLGAADGYYGIGVLVAKLFKKSYCFELTEKGREVIVQNAMLNDLSESIQIFGGADKNFYEQIPADDLNKSILFVDIEGAEFDILDENVFQKFSNSIIYIELHDWFYEDGYEKLENLKKNFRKTHEAIEIQTGARDMSIFSELSILSDSDSEGRGRLMKWLKLVPKLTSIN
jgi:Methyltransferase FkbM domain